MLSAGELGDGAVHLVELGRRLPRIRASPSVSTYARVMDEQHVGHAGEQELERDPGRNTWKSKAYTEELVQHAGLRFWTLIKASFFMENFVRLFVMFEGASGPPAHHDRA